MPWTHDSSQGGNDEGGVLDPIAQTTELLEDVGTVCQDLVQVCNAHTKFYVYLLLNQLNGFVWIQMSDAAVLVPAIQRGMSA